MMIAVKTVTKVKRTSLEIPYDSEHEDVLFVREPVSITDFWRIMNFHREAEEDYGHFPLHWHRCLEVIIPVRGCAEVWVKGRENIVNPGQMVILGSGEIHASRRARYDQSYDGYAVQFAWEYLNGVIPGFERLGFPAVPVEISEERLRKLSEVSEMMESDPLTGILRADIIMNEFLIELIQQYAFNKEQYLPKDQHELVIAAMNMLEENCCSSRSVAEIAGKLHISYAYLSRIFKVETGMTMLKMRDQFRMDRAKEMLCFTDEILEEISEKLGFPDSGQFSKSFRKTVGCSPSEYRRNRS